MHDLFGDVIHRYTRKQAIADGVLVDLDRFTARGKKVREHLGFKYPVAITGTAYSEVIEDAVARSAEPVLAAATRQFNLARLLNALRVAIAASATVGDSIRFTIAVLGRVIHLKAMCGPGDDAEPVITIMFPDED